MFKLALNAGHGNNTPGKRCAKSIDPNETKEYVLNKRICDLIQTGLSNYEGIEVLRIDDGSEMSITARARKANAWGANFYLSIHHNAGINGGKGGGIEAYVYLKVGDTTKEWQSSLYNACIKYTGLKGNRALPQKAADFGELRETSMPAVLMECGYMDSPEDTPIILTKEFASKIAAACIEVIIARSGATPKKPATPPTPVQPTLDISQIVQEVIAGKWGNGEERKQKLTDAGYDYATVQKAVNKACAAPAKKSNKEIAEEVIKGLWGNGEERKQKLTKAGYDYSTIQKLVNAMCK